jgi:hypothetical protein
VHDSGHSESGWRQISPRTSFPQPKKALRLPYGNDLEVVARVSDGGSSLPIASYRQRRSLILSICSATMFGREGRRGSLLYTCDVATLRNPGARRAHTHAGGACLAALGAWHTG